MNSLARNQGLFFAADKLSKHYFVNFTLFDNLDGKSKATINTVDNGYGVFYRTQIPIFMLWPIMHKLNSGIQLNEEQSDGVDKANFGLRHFYDENKIP